MRRISNNAFFYLINIIKLILTLLIQISESNLIRRYPGGSNLHYHHHATNPTIYVKVGDSINISCLFDPDVIAVNHNGKGHQLYGYTSYGQGKPLVGSSDSSVAATDNTYDQNTLGGGDDSSSMFSNYNFDNFRKKRQSLRVKNKHHHGRGGHAAIHTTSQPIAENEIKPAVGSSYELDWFFLNKNGVMNIISYGNKTASNKYQLFMSRDDEETSDQVDPATRLDGSQLSSYSSYSQTHSRSAALRKPATLLTHYLNVLIESEADEGVYQCINPNLANFIIRNVTVLFERNGQCKLVPASQTLLLSLLLIAYQFVNYLFK